METEKSYSILSFNWKEDNLLKKKLSFLETMKKYEANAWLMEQKAFYKRCHLKFQRSELAHARLLGNKELVKLLTNKSSFSTYSTTLVDDSEAAVKAIVEKRVEGRKNKMLFRFNLNKDTLYPAVRSGLLKDCQAASTVIPKANSKDNGGSTTLKMRSPSRVESKQTMVSSLQSPEQGAAQQRKFPEDSSPAPQEEKGIMDSCSKCPSTGQNNLQDPAIGRESKGKLLRYIVHGDINVEHPRKKRPSPRNNLHGPKDVPVDPALLNQIHNILRQESLMNERAKYLGETIRSLPQPTNFQNSIFKNPLEKGRQEALHVPRIGTHSARRGQKTSF